jgi:pimeloyl-ACP methyl ester carboxylesterase
MTDMPPPQFADVNGIRMGYHEAGPTSDAPPLVLCHGWPEIAYGWRHQIKTLSEAGLRVIAPDQRGYGATDRPEPVEAYDLEHLTGDLVGLLDHLKIDKAIFVGHDWGGFVVWHMPLRHPERVAGVIGINTPHHPRAPIDPIQIFRKRFGDSMYIVHFQDPSHEPDRIFAENLEKTFDFFFRGPVEGRTPAPAPGEAGFGASSKVNLAFPRIVAGYDPKLDKRKRILSPQEMSVYVETFRKTGFTGGINWYRNITRNWERSAEFGDVIKVPSLMIMAELDVVLPPAARAFPAEGSGEFALSAGRRLVIPARMA